MFVHNVFSIFYQPGNASLLQVVDKKIIAVVDIGPVQGWIEIELVQVQDAQGCMRTAGPAGGGADEDAHHSAPPGS